MPEPSRPFVTWLTTTMQSRGLTQAALAREVGVADAQVSRWRRGQVVPTVRYLQRLSDAFGVPRAALERLAGYPVDAAAGADAGADPDPELTAERLAYQAWYGHLLERTVPRGLWQAYAEACEALAEALATPVQTALAKARADAAARAAAGDEPDASQGAARKVGFGP